MLPLVPFSADPVPGQFLSRAAIDLFNRSLLSYNVFIKRRTPRSFFSIVHSPQPSMKLRMTFRAHRVAALFATCYLGHLAESTFSF